LRTGIHNYVTDTQVDLCLRIERLGYTVALQV
jgi:hypothetical protein